MLVQNKDETADRADLADALAIEEVPEDRPLLVELLSRHGARLGQTIVAAAGGAAGAGAGAGAATRRVGEDRQGDDSNTVHGWGLLHTCQLPADNTN